MKYYLLTIVSAALLFTSCKKDDPEPPTDPELITTLIYTLTPVSGDPVVMEFTDLDGDGGNDAVIVGGTLDANETYTGSIELLNESVDPTEDITEEVEELDEEHQLFFASSISDLNVAYADMDDDDNPVGLSSVLTTGGAGSGNITITLRHEPNKTGDGVSGGDISNAGGETDIEVTFPVDVE